MKTGSTPRLILMALPPTWWVERTVERLVRLGVVARLGNRLFRPELWHQSCSDRFFDPSRDEQDALLRAFRNIAARACTLHFNRVKAPASRSGPTHCTMLAQGRPKPFSELIDDVQRTLQESGFPSMAKKAEPHITLSYNARTSFESIPLDPPIAWTIDELCLVIGGGEPYRYEVIGRCPLLPELPPPAVQIHLF